MDYHKKSVTIPFLELEDRFTCLHFFEYDMPHSAALHAELHQWFAVWEDASESPHGFTDTIKQCDERDIPNMKAILWICCKFPITSAEREVYACPACAKNLFETYQFTSLALMYAHRFDINHTQVVEEIARRHPRKILLWNILNELVTKLFSVYLV